MSVEIIHGKCEILLPTLDAESFHACVCDPPYGLEFMGRDWDAPWQMSSKSALFGKRKREMPGWGVTRNPTCRSCGGRLRGARQCACEDPSWDEALEATRLRQMRGFQDWCEAWAREVYRVLKPGAHLLAFGGTRTFHRLSCAIEDAGFEIRDTVMWLYGSGFPKSHDVSKAIDRAAGAEREIVGLNPTYRAMQAEASAYNLSRNPHLTAPATEAARAWQGWGTALKPACEPIVVARKPLSEGTVAANVLRHGTGALNIDVGRVPVSAADRQSYGVNGDEGPPTVGVYGDRERVAYERSPQGRWPANVAHDGSPEVMDAFARFGTERGNHGQEAAFYPSGNHVYSDLSARHFPPRQHDTGTSDRFFFCAKADASERVGAHPTVKPISLMEWLVRLVCPNGGRVLDPFCGTGSTLVACDRLSFDAVGIEQDAQTVADAHEKIRRMRARRMIGDAKSVPVAEGQLKLFNL